MNRLEKLVIKVFPRLSAALYAFKHAGDKDYLVKTLQTDPSVFQFHKLGEKNPDKNIYFIRMGDKGDGFFAEFNRLLMYLYTAHKYNFTPVVLFTDGFRYSENEAVNGFSNPFQYYYLEPSDIEPEEALESHNVIFSSYIHTQQEELICLKEGLYGFSDDYIETLADIYKSYIRYNQVITDYLKKEQEGISRDTTFDKMIGVHFRGTDYRIRLEGHPVYIDSADVISKVEELLNDRRYDTVFLATDDSEALQRFVEVFGEKVRYYSDVYRSGSDTSVAFSDDSRENHRYKLGLEVIRDMETLSRCGALVAGLSQVSQAARIRKKSYGEEYRDICIIDKGIVKKGVSQDSFDRKVVKRN